MQNTRNYIQWVIAKKEARRVRILKKKIIAKSIIIGGALCMLYLLYGF